MPFRGIVKTLEPGKPVLLVTARPGDAQVLIGIKPYGSTHTAGPNFYIGGPRIKDELGMMVTSNERDLDLSEGDEVWVLLASDLEFAETWTITATVRSVPVGGSAGRHAG